MPEPASSMVVILLSSALGLLVLLIGLVIGVSRRLSRIERWVAGTMGREANPELAPSPAEIQAGGAFEMFLNEDPSRRELPKGEQFAEYRRWRQEKGLNWSKS